MLLKIGDATYDMEQILSKPSLNDLFYLKVKTKSEDFPAGVSLKSMSTHLERMGEMEDPTDILDDAELLLSLRALIYLCRRHVGEKVTLDSANDFALESLEFVVEPHDETTIAAAQGKAPAPADPQ